LEEEEMMEEHTFDTGTVAINYAEGPSSGLPLVLLHGGGASWHSLLKVIPDFIHTWHICALDFRGHGRSGRVPGAYRWVDYVQDTIAFLRHHFSEPVILWGQSLGAIVAVGVAAQAADTVRALVLEDPWLDLQTSEDEKQFLLYRRNLVAAIHSLDEMITALANESVTLPGHDEPVRRGEVEEDAEIRLEAEMLIQLDPEVYTLAWDGRLAEGYNMDAVLKQVACPTLLLQANPALGGRVDDELAGHAMALLPRGTLVSIPDARHDVYRSQPLAARQAVAQFLESL
jgi:pimeloyl-ACP methyl ester carboxylesterase